VLVNHDENGNLFAPVVHNGSPEKGMPKFSLTPALPQSEHTRKTVTVTLKSGQTLSGPLQHVDEFTISMYDAAGDYHTWARDAVTVEVHDPLAVHADLLRTYTDTDMHNVLAYLETLK
jgi:cytochrome c oxidase cbb3-type subunit III